MCFQTIKNYVLIVWETEGGMLSDFKDWLYNFRERGNQRTNTVVAVTSYHCLKF